MFLRLSVLRGFSLLVLTLLCLVVLLILVVVLFCFVLLYLWLIRGVILTVSFYSVNFHIVPNCFEFVIFMVQIGTLHETFFWMAFIQRLIPRYLLFLLEILILCLTVPLIVLVPIPRTHLGKALPPS